MEFIWITMITATLLALFDEQRNVKAHSASVGSTGHHEDSTLSVINCCEMGRQLFIVSSETCAMNRDDVNTETNWSNLHDVSCAVVRDVCCLAERRRRLCRRGVDQGLSGRTALGATCSSVDSDARECCGCCRLGRLAKESGMTCDPPFYYSDHCRQSYIECCTLRFDSPIATTKPTQSFTTRTTTTITTIRPATATPNSSSSSPATRRPGRLSYERFWTTVRPVDVATVDTTRKQQSGDFEFFDPCRSRKTHNCSQTERCVYSGRGGRFTCVSMPMQIARQPTSSPQPAMKCASGFMPSRRTNRCEDIDECRMSRTNCAEQGAVCVNTHGSYACIISAVERHQKQSSTLASWTSTPSVTTPLSLSTTTPVSVQQFTHRPRRRSKTSTNRDRSAGGSGSRVNSCLHGFSRNHINGECEDIDECRGTNACPGEGNMTCHNTIGSFTCVCQVGFHFNPRIKRCEDADECAVRRSNNSPSLCSDNEECVNTVGSYTCVPTASCTGGYTVDPVTRRCIDVDECRSLRSSLLCPRGTVCVNEPGSYICSPMNCSGTDSAAGAYCQPSSPQPMQCSRGSRLDPSTGTCVDVNECEDNTRSASPCRPNQVCINSPGSYVCRQRINCGLGYSVNQQGTRCDDIDECATGIHSCHHPLMTCINRPGTFLCQCPGGYQINHRIGTCDDVDECNQFGGQVCAQNARCENTLGSFRCVCEPGFQLDANTNVCKDVDECAAQPGVCEHDCRNTWGSFYCTCHDGYQLMDNGRTCSDVDECRVWAERGSIRTLCLGFCQNVPGSYVCTCPDGYEMNSDGRTCEDVDECAEQPWDLCPSADELCVNTRGGFLCQTVTCPSGFVKAPTASMSSPSATGSTHSLSSDMRRRQTMSDRRLWNVRTPAGVLRASTSTTEQPRNYVYLRSVSAKPVVFYANDESGVVCLKVECAVNDIGCLVNLTKSIQWQHVSVPSIANVDRPLVLVDVQTAAATDAFHPAGSDWHPASFNIIAGNALGLFDVVEQTTAAVNETNDNKVQARNERKGSVRLLRPLIGPAQYTVTLQMDVRSRQNIVMSQHIAELLASHLGRVPSRVTSHKGRVSSQVSSPKGV